MLNRRTFFTAAGAAMCAALSSARAQTADSNGSTPRDYGGVTPIHYPDPDVVALDNRFRKYMVGNTAIHRHYTGTLWAEGPAWNGVGRYLVWSDIPNNVQMRFIEEDSRVTVFRNPSGYSNGNTFDYEGRQLSCEHAGRRVVRYEYDGTVTVIADKFEGKRLNSPNDIVVHPDGGIWFTDPTYGIIGNYEGFRAEKENKESVYRVDGKSGQIARITDEFTGPITKRSTSPTPARGVRSKSSTRTAKPCATANVLCSSISLARMARRPRPTESAAMSMATSGAARGPACKW